ncbi:cuticle protein 7-like isoform X1 [Palaemon carinicauda]|uniref:cuticle protein 7-like isoform X1 n=1 Tax=Palaemon carinicauda TaxID=392227 RepID=UPI0035B655BA
MIMKVLLVALGLAALVAADSRERYAYAAPRASSSSEESYESSEAKYNFNWAVSDSSSSNEFGHQEARDGDDTQGSYYVQLPDSRLQKVSYHVDGDDGYVAEVTYEGEAQFDSVESYESASDESFEAPRYAPPPRRYYAPDSNESK